MANSYGYVTLDGSRTYDPRDNSLNFSWPQFDQNPILSLSNYNTANPTFVAPVFVYPTTLTF
jgi:hypothetical protein